MEMNLATMPVEADSQFEAIARSVEGKGRKEDRHRTVRARIVTEIDNNREYYAPILERQGKDFDSYVRYMRFVGSPGDDVTLLAASREYQVVIVVLHGNAPTDVIFDPLGPNAVHLYLYCRQATHEQYDVYDVVLFSRGQAMCQGSQALRLIHARASRVPLSQMPRKIWRVCCQGCNQDNSDDGPCSATFCDDWQRGECVKGADGRCQHGLCHAIEGGYKGECARNVLAVKSKKGRKRQMQTTNLAVEQAQLAAAPSLLAAHGVIVKNGFYDVNIEQEKSRPPRARSCDTMWSKDPCCRESCRLCITDEELRRERATKLYYGRVTMLAITGMLDLCAGPEVASELQQMMAFAKASIRTRASGGVFDPLGQLLLCEKVLCKHWLRGECKSGQNCKFCHCHPGHFA